ncbi:MAG TPA: hypothetical protein PK804_01610 [Candidatus Dojkabacteria bacterium]|jgi:hypothetical protein|uniref:Uncharacterized protein n=1 Tax=Candidatus Dojkabacteria bacterium TaxID=2099670 RepID=A0A847CYZ3_9BACT|nr:hypothetical protein [Candidatus Dojkabacteria bacterium]NLD25168.1 hypothetical protein [Candidatus Dojkabacteria bacterium]HQC39329.1 hypothetical protein [Candidatus Dojkabacteria bacterium]HRY74403.1 hypothetical protein [Candidatus Dojkabacteria bacterium]HRZ84511.1 hypothetical protein [Candidatus Dojkabacteria bacterium]
MENEIETKGENLDSTIEEINQQITNQVLAEYPKYFEEYLLDDGSNIALLQNNRRIPEEDKEILPPYQFIALSKYGLTEFNCSYSPLEWERTKKAIMLLIELSCGEEIKDMVVSHWHAFHRIRKTKGLIKLKKNIKSVLITGVNMLFEVKDFYYNTLLSTNLGKLDES